MKQQKCLLCGHEYPAGLNIMGCLICFPCEKRILCEAEETRYRAAPRALLRLYRGNAGKPRTVAFIR